MIKFSYKFLVSIFFARAFAIICRIVLVFLAVHIIALLAYQAPFPQEYFTDNSTTIRQGIYLNDEKNHFLFK